MLSQNGIDGLLCLIGLVPHTSRTLHKRSMSANTAAQSIVLQTPIAVICFAVSTLAPFTISSTALTVTAAPPLYQPAHHQRWNHAATITVNIAVPQQHQQHHDFFTSSLPRAFTTAATAGVIHSLHSRSVSA